MLYLVGAGLGSIEDLTLKGCEAIKKSDHVYLESYTSKMSAGIEEYSEYFGKLIILADRELIEENAHTLITQAQTSNVSIIVIGDPLGATTHSDLLQRCVQHQIPYSIIHNTSIMVAVAECGLQLYKFGETVSIVAWSDNWKPDSFYDKICDNYARGLHTLCLLDIKLNERNIEKMMNRIREYDPPFFLTAQRSCEILLEITSQRSKFNADVGVSDLPTKKTLPSNLHCVVMGRIGWPDQCMYQSTVEELAVNTTLNDICPQTLVIPAEPAQYEIEFVNTFCKRL